jgi:hypothetical protein
MLRHYTSARSNLLYSTLLYTPGTILYSTPLYYTILYSTLLYSTLLYSTAADLERVRFLTANLTATVAADLSIRLLMTNDILAFSDACLLQDPLSAHR